MAATQDDLLYMAAVILMPIVPAYLLFKLLPGAAADAEGPFKGLKIKLGGAFAGYFIVMLAAFELLDQEIKPSRVELWRVNGVVSLGKEANRLPITAVRLRLKPPHSDVEGSGSFAFLLPIDLHHSHAWEVPKLIISYPGFEVVTLELDPDGHHVATYGDPNQKNVHVDEHDKTFNIERIVLAKAETP